MRRFKYLMVGLATWLVLTVASLLISVDVHSMCNDEVFVSATEYITGCISNPGLVSPGECLYSVRLKPRNGSVSNTGAYYTYLGKTGRNSFKVLYRWYTPFKSSPEFEEKIDMQITKGRDQPIQLRSASDCTAALVKVLGFKGDQLEHQILIPETCRAKINQ